MCLFCAAIPMTVTLGTAARGKISEKRRLAQSEDKPVVINLPVEKITVGLVTTLIVCAVIYHSSPISAKLGI